MNILDEITVYHAMSFDLVRSRNLKNVTTLKHNWVIQFKTTNFWFVFVCYALFFLILESLSTVNGS